MNNELTKEFIPFEESKELKALGFDEWCFGYYYKKELVTAVLVKNNLKMGENVTQAPIFHQAFKFFRDRLRMYPCIYDFEVISAGGGGYRWQFQILTIDSFDSDDSNELLGFLTYEEAELACLKKLILLAKKVEPKDPHEVSKVKCDLCSYTWVAVRPEGLTKIECPHCGNMVNFENIPLD